jgi:N-acetylglucosamine-6-phosphate deacetylase
MCKRYVICGGKIITEEKILEGKSLLIEGGKIKDVISKEEQIPEGYRVLDAAGLYVSAGFVDIHQHGGGGSDYMDEDEDAYFHILHAHMRHGMTSVMPTVLSAGKNSTIRAIERYKAAEKDTRIPCHLLGLHMEGPYLSLNQAGAQKPENIRAFDPQEYEELYECSEGKIKRWSVAPEIAGAEDFARFALQNGIELSIAHSDADFDTVLKAYDMGFHHVTHLYSGMSSVTRRGGFRVAGVLEAAFYLDHMNVEIIADGCHLPLSLLALIAKLKSEETIALVTDAMRAAGQNVKESFLGSKEDAVPVVIEDGVAKMLNREAFAGSIATPDRLIRTMREAGISLVDAVKMMTVNPLRMMDFNGKKGKIQVGYDADLCLFDEKICVKYVIADGELVVDNTSD